MTQDSKVIKWTPTVCRAILFCLCCAIILAASSRLMQGLPVTEWNQFTLVMIASLGALILTILFSRWEGLQLRAIGLIPGSQSISRLLIGFTVGLFLAIMQPLLVLMTGHISLVRSSEITFVTIVTNLLLYLGIACREELAFRGYPLRSLNYVIGSWKAQLIVAFIFAAEHVAGGMTWSQALLGAGLGSILFGLAALKTKGLALPIGLHAAWNFGQWSLGFKNGAGIYNAVIEKGYETRVEQVGMISYLIIMALAILAFHRLFFLKGTCFSS
ncbi:CPBP family intramembrane glutamic endopeptidase [Pedobacter cryoconitis]|uniref:CAAX prenyl protease 2/Lysostaphin resistance protein A-like domain-containing protein n=1 Tax=Pedobacter cryoconitis TaxID=188932 RepID=A0A7X0MHI7_9SPHI|nr:CPBP family intramembrane glutamic endopeptidase [Pedobacter cryoconitis]MBB6499397.1 hypothetical protein [Pedobacter cryoconitis]